MFGNTFGRTTKTYAGGKKVFHEVSGVYPVGGTIDVSSTAEGTILRAGTPVIFNMANKTITIVSSVTDSNKAQINGLLLHDVVVDAFSKDATNGKATGSVVYAAEVYVNRLSVDITNALPYLPQIVAIKEA